jgi:methanethiol S-methyltransferase
MTAIEMPTPSQARASAAAVAATFATAALFNLANVWSVAFLANVDLGLPIVDGPERMPAAVAAAINVGLITLFGLQHSVMARPSFKAWLARFIDGRFERTVYVLASTLVLAIAMALWQPILTPVWSVSAEPVRWALWGLFGCGWVLVGLAMMAIDPVEFLGIRQAVAAWRGVEAAPTPFKTPFPYRLVRHPMQLGILVALWATPHMTAGHLVYAATMTLYILIGLRFEERALVRSFGVTYIAYQWETPMLLPLPRRLRMR